MPVYARRFVSLVVLLVLAVVAAPLAAQQPDLIPREVLFGNPERTSP